MWARGGCDRIDAVVFQDDAAFVMSLLGSRMLLYVFERMFTGIDFDPPAAAAVESQRYGYRLRVPGDWTSTLATHPGAAIAHRSAPRPTRSSDRPHWGHHV